MNTFLIRGASVLAGLALMLTGCGSQSASQSHVEGSTGKLKVIATFYPMAEFSRQVGGDHVEVTGLIPSGTEPHDWEPSAKDMAAISSADVFVYNGIVETWAEQALGSAANDKRVAVEASQGITLMEGTDEDGHEDKLGHPADPHVWLDPVLAQKEVRSIQAALEKADPEHKDDYQRNADAYAAKLETLDAQYKAALANAPRKDFVTSHAAFAYLAKQYGLKQVAISGLSPDQEPSPEQMARVVRFVKDNGVKTIFFEELVDSKLADTIASETGAATDVLNPLEGLTKEEQAQKEDYLSIMQKNLLALEKALHE